MSLNDESKAQYYENIKSHVKQLESICQSYKLTSSKWTEICNEICNDAENLNHDKASLLRKRLGAVKLTTIDLRDQSLENSYADSVDPEALREIIPVNEDNMTRIKKALMYVAALLATGVVVGVGIGYCIDFFGDQIEPDDGEFVGQSNF
jgi:hypothetical protein